MAHVRQANRFGRPHELAEHDEAFSASGESMYSRRVAKAGANFKFDRPPRRIRGRKHTPAELITECERRLEWMEAELRIETDPTRKAKLAKDISIRGTFLTRLLAERDSQ